MTEEASIAETFAKVGKLDAVASAAGELHFGPLIDMTTEQLAFSTTQKLLGQVNLARCGARHLSDGGSITLVSGIIGEQLVVGGSTAALVNAGLEGFALGASVDMPRGSALTS